MPEILWVVGLLLFIGAISAVQVVPWPMLIESGNDLMLATAAVGIPLEIVYYALLAVALFWGAGLPRGWYWRPFQHHHLLGPRQRWLVLPWFYLGALAFLGIVLGIAVVLLGMLGAAVQSRA